MGAAARRLARPPGGLLLFGDFGGGKAYKGGASIPLNFYGNLENGEKENFWKITCKHMFRKTLKESFQDGEHKEEE